MPIYSHSRISSFESCPLKYRFRYLDRIKTGVDGVEAFMGSRVHETLERLYREKKRGVLPKLPSLLSHYESNWERHWHPKVRIVRSGKTAEHYNQIGRDCITSYYERFVPFDEGRTISIEQRVMFTLDGDGRYKMQGYIDRLVEAEDGTVEIHDYKTSASLPRQTALDEDRQLALYQIGVQEKDPDAHNVVLVWHYLRHKKTLTSRRTPNDLLSLREETIVLIREIEEAKEYPARESKLCAWCDYADMCPAWEGRPAPYPL